MRRHLKPISIIVILLLVFVILASSVRISSPADADNPVLSTQPSTEATQESTEVTTEPTQPTETTAPTTPPVQKPPSISSPIAFIYDCRIDAFLYTTGNVHEMLYPASVTKLFTAYVALMYLDPSDTATVGSILQTLPSDSSIAYLDLKDRLSVSDLIMGMLLPSGGDAARVLAVAAGQRLLGTSDQADTVYYQAFVDEMNRQAALLGMNDSHFENPDGYHAANHYISLADAVQLGKLCLSSPFIMECASTKVHITKVQNTGRELQWVNTNKLLSETRYPEFYCAQAIGLKTGYTAKAGNCLLSAFQVEDGQLIIGIFGAESRDDSFNDTLRLFRYATK